MRAWVAAAFVFLAWLIAGCSATAEKSPSAIWYWKGYQVESNGDRYQFEIWARSEPPLSHDVMRDEKGEIVSETITNAVHYTTYAGGMEIAAPSGVKEPKVNILYGVQRLTPSWVQELQSRSTLVTDRDRILSEMVVYLGDSSSAPAADDLQMYSEVGEAGLQTTYVFDRADGHVYVRRTMRDGEVVRVTVFPNKPVIWESAAPFAPLSPVSGKGTFQSPLAGQSK